MADEKKSRLETTTEVFDGWKKIKIGATPASSEIYGKPIDFNAYVAVKGNGELFEIPEGTLYWHLEQGHTPHWAQIDRSSSKRLFQGDTYLVPKAWYESL
ncbi:MAG: hypothetical protein AABX11_04940 [Nanoarchaeota archaeon]